VSKARSEAVKARVAGKARAATKPRRPWRRAFSYVTTLLLTGFLLFLTYFGVLLYRANGMVENVGEIMSKLATRPTTFVSADGVKLAEFQTIYRDPVNLNEIPKVMQNATIAAEDKRFWSHQGIDPVGMTRAAWSTLSGGPTQGGSTLAQQLAKRLYTTQERTISRKLQDIALGIQLERKLTKQQVLELYLNQVYYGAGAYGIKAAADVYFNKDLDELSLGQCAMLARLPRRPSTANPFVNPEAAKKNRDVVLNLMNDQGLITQSQCDQAKLEPVKLAKRRVMAQSNWKAPYAVADAMHRLQEMMDPEQLYSGGYKVELTIDYRMQQAAEEALKDTLKSTRRRGVTDGAVFLMDLQGHTLVMVGGADFNRNQFNVITQGHRQPGSSFKPLLYSVGFDLGILGPDSTVQDSRRTYQSPGGRPYSPENSDGHYSGSISVRRAITYSKNAAAVYANSIIGPIRAASEIQQKFGFTTTIAPVMSLPLGATAVRPIEMAEAFTVFPTGGTRVRPYLISRILSPDGTVVQQVSASIFRNVLSESAAQDMDSILRDAVTRGTGNKARGVEDAHGKTGTTSEYRDAWFVGYAGNYVGLAWVASPYQDPTTKRWAYRQMNRVYGGTVPVVIWANMMKAISGLPGVSFEKLPFDNADESGMVTVSICSESSQLATGNCRHTERQSFVPGTQPTASCPLHPTEEYRRRMPREEPVPTPEVAPRDTAPPEQVQPESTGATVTIWICADSGLPANSYCPEAVPREFPAGKVPRGVCKVHGP